MVDPKGLNPLAGCALGSLGGPIGCGAGAAIGGAAALGIGLYCEFAKCSTTPPPPSIPQNPANTSQCTMSCPPCTPYPVGTIGYQGPKTSTRGIHGTRAGTGKQHYILFEVQQNPQTCQCRWQENKKIAGHHYMWQPNLFLTINLNGKGRPPSYP